MATQTEELKLIVSLNDQASAGLKQISEGTAKLTGQTQDPEKAQRAENEPKRQVIVLKKQCPKVSGSYILGWPVIARWTDQESIVRKTITTIAGAAALLASVGASQAGLLPEDKVAIIRQQCADEWPTDFNMRLYCENKQMKALRELIERGAIAPSKNNKAEVAAMAALSAAFAKERCNLIVIQFGKLKARVEGDMQEMGFDWNTIPNTAVEAVLREHPQFVSAMKGEEPMRTLICDGVTR
jgi:hypothetical protein